MSKKRHHTGQSPADAAAAPAGSGQTLRERAEARVRTLEPNSLSAQTAEELRVLQELRVRQIELEMQNEELRAARDQIEAGRARYFDLYEMAPVGYCTLSEQGLILEANLTAATLLGVARGELVGQSISHYILQEDQDVFHLHRMKLLETSNPQECELRLIRADGALLWAHWTTIAAQAEDGSPVCRVVLTDTTERRQAELRLAASEEKQRRLFETMGEGVFYQQADGMLIDVNEAALRMFGLSREEFLSRTSLHSEWDVIQEDGTPLPGPQHPSMQAIRTGRPVRDVVVGVRNSQTGTYTWVSASAIPEFRQGASTPYQVAVTMHDLTARKEAEAELRRRESLLQKIFDLLPVGLWIADKDGRLLRGNPAGVRIWGAEPRVAPSDYGVFKARRLPSREELLPEDWALARTIREGATIENELLEIDAFDGQTRTILNSTAPVLDDQGAVQGAVIVNVDITERKRAEAERESLQAQLSQAQKMESVGRLAGGVAHDFNNMLLAILGNTELALEELPPGTSVRANLLEIQKAAQHSADLTRQLLAFARKQTVAPKVLNLNDTVEGMLKVLRRLIGEDIDLAWLPGKGVWPVKMDPSQIDQILANLCVNARDAIADVGKLTIETDRASFDEEYCSRHEGFVPGDYVLLSVSDDGCGMDAETLSRVFEPFFTTKELGKGTGLGLATVYGVVKQNGGHITASSEPGEGTTFKVYLPRHADQTTQQTGERGTRAAARGSETVLLVEDEPAILRITTSMLARLGYTVLAASTPDEAIRLARECSGRIDLLMTDVVLPEMNGRALVRSLLSIYPDIRILFMSGYAADVIAHHGVLDPGMHFIQKPFPSKKLGAMLREILDGEPVQRRRST